jgi:hypothetical protein
MDRSVGLTLDMGWLFTSVDQKAGQSLHLINSFQSWRFSLTAKLPNHFIPAQCQDKGI